MVHLPLPESSIIAHLLHLDDWSNTPCPPTHDPLVHSGANSASRLLLIHPAEAPRPCPELAPSGRTRVFPACFLYLSGRRIPDQCCMTPSKWSKWRADSLWAIMHLADPGVVAS